MLFTAIKKGYKAMFTGIHEAVQAAGTQVKLAERLGVTQQAISTWLKQGWAPMDRAREIEMQFGIPRTRLVNPRIVAMLDSELAL
jgi:hypothetical protein